MTNKSKSNIISVSQRGESKRRKHILWYLLFLTLCGIIVWGGYKMEEKFRIVATDVDIPVMDGNGNVIYKTGIQKHHIINFRGDVVSREYYAIEHLKDDYYIVVDAASSQISMLFSDVLNDNRLMYKYGLVCLKRDNENKVIPMEEDIVVPFIYDGIAENNADTITVRVNDKFTYVDLDKESINYGRQLTPAVLDRVVPFGVSYDGYAECELNGVTGFIPRNITPTSEISPAKLLTKEQVEHLISMNTQLHVTAIEKLYNLTGTSSLALTRKPQRR